MGAVNLVYTRSMQTFVTLCSIALPVFIVADLLWLGVLARDFYARHLGYILGEVFWPAAIIFYVVFIFGITYFVMLPLLSAPLMRVAITGALFGFITYATYDLTNQATLRDWPLAVTVVDIIWGSLLGAIVATTTIAVYRLVFSAV